MQGKTDFEYVQFLKKDDFSAFDSLFHKYAQSLYAFALSLTREPFSAEEIIGKEYQYRIYKPLF